jgi:hypothetical protein
MELLQEPTPLAPGAESPGEYQVWKDEKQHRKDPRRNHRWTDPQKTWIRVYYKSIKGNIDWDLAYALFMECFSLYDLPTRKGFYETCLRNLKGKLKARKANPPTSNRQKPTPVGLTLQVLAEAAEEDNAENGGGKDSADTPVAGFPHHAFGDDALESFLRNLTRGSDEELGGATSEDDSEDWEALSGEPAYRLHYSGPDEPGGAARGLCQDTPYDFESLVRVSDDSDDAEDSEYPTSICFLRLADL